MTYSDVCNVCSTIFHLMGSDFGQGQKYVCLFEPVLLTVQVWMPDTLFNLCRLRGNLE